MKFSRKYTRKTTRKPTLKKTVKKAIKSASNRIFKKKVLSVIHAQAEDKIAYTGTGDSLVYFNSGITSSGDIMKIIPNITNNSSDSGRVGDEIRAKSIQIKGALIMANNLSQNTTSPIRIAVRLMIVQPKRYNSFADIQANYSTWNSALLKKGGTQSNFTGTLSDLWAPINEDEIVKYYDKVYYMDQPYIFSQNFTGATVSPPTELTLHNTVKMFNIKLRCRNKKLQYDPSSDSGALPTNYNPVLILGYTHLDGSSADVVNTQVALTYDSMFYFEDL